MVGEAQYPYRGSHTRVSTHLLAVHAASAAHRRRQTIGSQWLLVPDKVADPPARDRLSLAEERDPGRRCATCRFVVVDHRVPQVRTGLGRWYLQGRVGTRFALSAPRRSAQVGSRSVGSSPSAQQPEVSGVAQRSSDCHQGSPTVTVSSRTLSHPGFS